MYLVWIYEGGEWKVVDVFRTKEEARFQYFIMRMIGFQARMTFGKNWVVNFTR